MREIHPSRKVSGRVANVLAAQGDDFVSGEVDGIRLTFDGIEGDFHAGLTRASGGREPWYKRGTVMRNERQVSILSVEELAEIAGAMGIDRLEPGWIGSNLVLEGIEALSFLPARTLLFFEGGVTLRVDGYNAPCRFAGGMVARHCGVDPQGGEYRDTQMAMAFTAAADMKRGLVAWVEREGTIKSGETVSARIWPQWIY